MPTVIHAHDGQRYHTTESLDEVGPLLAAGAHLWIDTDEDGPEIARFLHEVLEVHPLAVEDVLQDRPHPKIEDYGAYLYIVLHGINRHRAETEDLETVELDLILAARWVFTHHAVVMRSVDTVSDELRRNPRPLERGPGFVAHALFDHMIDHYLPVIDQFDEDADDVETQVIERPSPEVLQRIFRLKRSLQHLRRIAIHQRDVLSRLSRGEFELVPEKALPFFRDVYEHFVRVAELADSYREILSGALEAYLSVVSNRMNEIMKTLTLVATVMMPLTFIAGVYGMNFEHMPELKWRFGYLLAWLLMLTVGGGMILWFRRRRWL